MNHYRLNRARPGWTQRYANVIEALRVVGLFLAFITLLAGMYAAVVVAAAMTDSL